MNRAGCHRRSRQRTVTRPDGRAGPAGRAAPWTRLTERTRRRLAFVCDRRRARRWCDQHRAATRCAGASGRADTASCTQRSTRAACSPLRKPPDGRALAQSQARCRSGSKRYGSTRQASSAAVRISSAIALAAGRTTPVSLDVGRAICTPDGQAGVTSTDPVVTAGRTASRWLQGDPADRARRQLIAAYQADCALEYDHERFVESPAAGGWSPAAAGQCCGRRSCTPARHATRIASRAQASSRYGYLAFQSRHRHRSQAAVPFEITVTVRRPAAGRLRSRRLSA